MRKLSLVYLFFMQMVIHSDAQIVSLFKTAAHRIYLQSNLKLGLQLMYYNVGPSEQYLPTFTAYSLDANLKADSNGKKYLPLSFYHFGYYSKDKMNIDLYFDELPDSISIYLNIPLFKIGYRKIHVSLKDIQTAPLKPTPYPHDAYDITGIIFPEQKAKILH